MAHFINIAFFAVVLLGGFVVLALTVRQYWNEILAALMGDAGVRSTNRPWTKRVRVTARPRTQVARQARSRAAA